MRNLLERLKPRYMSKLTEAMDNEPEHVKPIINVLFRLELVGDLTLLNATTLLHYTTGGNFTLYDIYSLFDEK